LFYYGWSRIYGYDWIYGWSRSYDWSWSYDWSRIYDYGWSWSYFCFPSSFCWFCAPALFDVYYIGFSENHVAAFFVVSIQQAFLYPTINSNFVYVVNIGNIFYRIVNGWNRVFVSRRNSVARRSFVIRLNTILSLRAGFFPTSTRF
jgi:hypothetical protein